VARRSRMASGALMLVLLAVSVFAVWTSQATGIAASRAVAASAVSDDYARAASAVSAEESLERKYRLEPGPGVRARYEEVAAALVAALGEVRRDGDASDRALVDRILVEHRDYLAAIDRMFAAIDRGDTPTALRVDRDETEPAFAAIDDAVRAGAADEHQLALAELADLQRLEALTRWLTPLVFLTGLLLAAVLASITRGNRRLLNVERARAVHDSLHDALTGCPNRTLLVDRCGQALRADARAGTSTALLVIGLDRFKEINDTFGHHHGEELLSGATSLRATTCRAPSRPPPSTRGAPGVASPPCIAQPPCHRHPRSPARRLWRRSCHDSHHPAGHRRRLGPRQRDAARRWPVSTKVGTFQSLVAGRTLPTGCRPADPTGLGRRPGRDASQACLRRRHHHLRPAHPADGEPPPADPAPRSTGHPHQARQPRLPPDQQLRA
jgi:GGDEF domain-containing protein